MFIIRRLSPIFSFLYSASVRDNVVRSTNIKIFEEPSGKGTKVSLQDVSFFVAESLLGSRKVNSRLNPEWRCPRTSVDKELV